MVARPEAVLAEARRSGGSRATGSSHRFEPILAACFSACLANSASAALRCSACASAAATSVVVGGVGEGVAARVAADDRAAAPSRLVVATPLAPLRALACMTWPAAAVGGADELRVGRGDGAAGGDREGGDAEQDRGRREPAEQRLARSRRRRRGRRCVDRRVGAARPALDGGAGAAATAGRSGVVCGGTFAGLRDGVRGVDWVTDCGRARRACPHGGDPWTCSVIRGRDDEPRL